MTGRDDIRCANCKALGVECPRGYFGGKVHCDVCGYEFALAAAMCAPLVTCPQCTGSVTYDPGRSGE